jgi:hypothetical protein
MAEVRLDEDTVALQESIRDSVGVHQRADWDDHRGSLHTLALRVAFPTVRWLHRWLRRRPLALNAGLCMYVV